MFPLSAAAEWIFWPLYINIPANMGVGLQRYCSNRLMSSKPFTDFEPCCHLGTFCSRTEVTLLGRKNPQKGFGCSHLGLYHIKAQTHKTDVPQKKHCCLLTLICCNQRLFFRHYRCYQGDRPEAVTPCLLVSEPAKKNRCQLFHHDKWATLFPRLISLFAAPRLGLSGRQPPLIIIFFTTACTDNLPFHATSAPVSAFLLPSACPDLLKPVLLLYKLDELK